MKKRIVIISAKGRDTFTISQQVRLEELGNMTYYAALKPVPLDTLTEWLHDADIAGVTPRSVTSIDGSWINSLPSLKGIAVFATGVDYIDTKLLAQRHILLSHLPDYSAISVSEHTLGMILTLSRRIHLSTDRISGRVPATTSVQGWELSGKTIGVVGLGRIGSRVAALSRAFGMRVLGYDIKDITLPEVEQVNMEELLSSSDIVSLHIPSKWQSTPIFGSDEVNMMKKGSYMINVSRASLVDDSAIVEAITNGHLKGYAVDDVFSLQDREEKLIQEGRILQTGHTAWYSQEVIERGYDAWVENICRLAEDLPLNLIKEE
jgi:phosphoglycerate dehydrogenase-like enzyme